MKTTIGIIGGGQLGKMLAQEARRMAIQVIVLDPTLDCPAKAVSDQQIVADFKDPDAIRTLSRLSDILTYEIEISNIEILKELEKEGRKIFPSPTVLEIILDKFVQKEFLKNHGLPVPKFRELNMNQQSPCAQNPKELLEKIFSQFGYPLLLKARKDSYDGRGNLTMLSESELESLWETKFLNDGLSQGKYMLEKFVPFKMEISVMVARNLSHQLICFPVAENIHQEHILKMTIAPARISADLAEKAKSISQKAVECLNGVGIFGVEMFVDQNNQILINEIAPRPHNSGHYTIEACDHSQFELHLRAILNIPLVQPKLLSPAVMLNILGQEDSSSSYKIEGLQEVLSLPGIKLHLYGKKNLRRKRKLGHITILDEHLEKAIEKANQVNAKIKAVPDSP